MNRPLVLKLQIPYPTRKDGKGDEVLVDIEVKLYTLAYFLLDYLLMVFV